MPNRILRDWTASAKVDKLSPLAEIFFTRLIMKADDYGRHPANVILLKSTLYPLKKNVHEKQVAQWLTECNLNRLIIVYGVGEKEFLEINDFGQRLRLKKIKYPGPDDADYIRQPDAGQMTVIRPLETNRNESNPKLIGNEPVNDDTHTPEEKGYFKNFQDFVSKNAPDVARLKEPLTIDQYLKLRDRIPKAALIQLVKAMHNKKDLLEKYKSAYLTILAWHARDEKDKGDTGQPENGTDAREKHSRELLNMITK